MSSKKYGSVGNGKRDCIPTPEELRKIKRISIESFLYLKELFKNFRRDAIKPQRFSNSLGHRAPTINDLKARIHLTRGLVSKKQTVTPKKSDIATQGYWHSYEPTQISNVYDSLFWQWRRVAEWERYINDPYENIKWTHDNLI